VYRDDTDKIEIVTEPGKKSKPSLIEEKA